MIQVFRSSILHFPQPTQEPDKEFEYFADGFLVTRNGEILAVGPYSQLPEEFNATPITNYSGKLIVPGLIDSHLHFPQTEMIASFGEQLLEWLQNYTFPTEAKFANEHYASAMADVFLSLLIANGTTTALVYSTVHKHAAAALFASAAKIDMRLIVGKVCMDRNCPDSLKDTPQSAQRDSADLIDAWHGHKRLMYAITPRFAPTSSPAQFAALGELAQQYPDVFIQTHLSENKHEIAWVKQLYPQFSNYLAVYDHYNMVRERSIFGHCLHLDSDEWLVMQERNATVAFCPSSNLFLGSGLFDLEQAAKHNVPVTLATDVGAGTSFNMLRTLGEAYKVCQLNHTRLSPLQGLYMMTMGSAIALNLEDCIGNLNPHTEADFVVLDPEFNELAKLRTNGRDFTDPKDLIFALSILGDERAIHATYVAGKNLYKKTQECA